MQKTIILVDRTLGFYQASQGAPSPLKGIEKELAQTLPLELKIDSSQSLIKLELQLETACEELENIRRLRSDVESEATQHSDRARPIVRVVLDENQQFASELTQVLPENTIQRQYEGVKDKGVFGNSDFRI